MKTTNPVDVARVELLLADLRLPAIKLMWAELAQQSDKEGWPAARFLAALAEHEIADRGRRRIERHLAEARLPVGKTLDSFDFEAVPMISKAHVMGIFTLALGWADPEGAAVLVDQLEAQWEKVQQNMVVTADKEVYRERPVKKVKKVPGAMTQKTLF